MSFYDPDLCEDIMGVEEFVRQVSEDGFSLETNPEAMTEEDLFGCWACLHHLVDDARLVLLHADPSDEGEMLKFVREIAQRERVPRDQRGERPTDWHVLAEAVRVSRAFEDRATELVRELAPAHRM